MFDDPRWYAAIGVIIGIGIAGWYLYRSDAREQAGFEMQMETQRFFMDKMKVQDMEQHLD